MTTNRTPATDLAACIDANVPVLLMGAPGTAKTAMLEAIAADRAMHLEVVIASAQDPTTILGIPMPSADRKYTEPTMPGWARRINDCNDGKCDPAHTGGTMLFLDELTTVPPSVAGPLLGVVQSRRADGWTLPDDTRIVAAANPPDLAVGGWAIEPAMANRWAHIEWPVPFAEWVAWAAAQPSPTLQLIAEYIGATGERTLLSVPPSVVARSQAWPSPRAWTRAAAIIDRTGDPSMAALTVGAAAGDMFAAWARKRDVPSVAELLDGSRAMPDRPDAFASSVSALVDAVTADTLDRTVDILTAAVPTDPVVIAIAAQTLGRRRFAAGLAELVAACEAAGVDFGTL